MEVASIGVPTSDLWTIYVDGACNSRGSGVGIVIFTPTGGTEKIVYLHHFPRNKQCGRVRGNFNGTISVMVVESKESSDAAQFMPDSQLG